MTPLPKNKITRVERGKRRAGNTPKLKRDPRQTPIPQHKDKIVQKLKLIMQPKTKLDEQEQKTKLAAAMSNKRPAKKKQK